jgi:hypothetical protein
VGDADRGRDPLNPALHQHEVGVVTQAQGVQPLSLGAGDVTRRGIALRISVCVVPDERLPVRIARSLDRVTNLLPGQRHAFSLRFSHEGALAACHTANPS